MNAYVKSVLVLSCLFCSPVLARKHSDGDHVGLRARLRGAWNYFVAKKHVIGSRPAGLFSNFCGVLNHLAWCEKHGMTPVVYWDQDSPYWQSDGYNGSCNVWEYYFEPVSAKTAMAHEPRDRRYELDGKAPFYFTSIDHEAVCLAHAFINRYIKTKAAVKDKVDSFFAQHMAGKKTIGIHLRGANKATEVPPVDPLVILMRANEEAEKWGSCQFFVATDEYRLLELAKEKLIRPVICYACLRAHDASPLFFSNSIKEKAILGEDVLVEALLLAQCDLFLHTYSNVSAAVLYFNPELKNILFT